MTKIIYSVSFNSDDLTPKIKDQLVKGVFGTINLTSSLTEQDIASGRLSSMVTLNLTTNQLDLELLPSNSGTYLKTFLDLGFNMTPEIIFDYPNKVSHVNLKIQGVGISPTKINSNHSHYPESLWNNVLDMSISFGNNKEDNNYIKEWDLKL